MDKRVIWLLSALVVIVAIGVGLYANELSRQASARRAAVRAAREAEINDGIRTFNSAIKTYCHDGDTIKFDPFKPPAQPANIKPDSPEWDKWQCDTARWERADWYWDLKKLQEEDR